MRIFATTNRPAALLVLLCLPRTARDDHWPAPNRYVDAFAARAIAAGYDAFAITLDVMLVSRREVRTIRWPCEAVL